MNTTKINSTKTSPWEFRVVLLVIFLFAASGPVVAQSVQMSVPQGICVGTQYQFYVSGGSCPTADIQWTFDTNLDMGTLHGTTYGVSTVNASWSSTTSNTAIIAYCNSNPGLTVATSGLVVNASGGTASVSISGPTTICAGANATYTASPTNGGGSPGYQWKKNGTVVQNGGSSYTTNQLVLNDVVTLVMASSVPCITNPQATSNSITISTVNQPVTPSANVPQSGTICPGPVSFTVTPTNGGGSPTYEWYRGANPVTDNQSSGATYQPYYTLTTGETIKCLMTTSAGCVTAATVWSNTVTISVVSTPATPGALDPTSITTASCTARWNTSSGSVAYYLDIANNDSFTNFVSGYNGSYQGSNTSVGVTGLTAGNMYYYRVRGENCYSQSGNSNTVYFRTVPPAPTIAGPTSIAETSFVANWSAANGAANYLVDVATTSNFSSGFVLNGVSVTDIFRSVTGLTGGTTYYYRVRAQNAWGTSANSSTQSVLTRPPAPTANAATGMTASAFTANWSSATSATSYRLDVSTSSGFGSFVSGYNDLNVGNVTTYAVNSGLSAGTTYYYRVRAVNASGASANSGNQSALLIPPAPTANAATSVTTTSFTANWSAANGAASYRLDVSTVNNFASFVSGYNNLTVSGTSQSVTGLSPGTTYYYRLRAVNASGTSTNSGTITVLQAPDAPVAIAASSFTITSLNANWNSVASAASYRLDVSTVNNFASFVSGFNNLTVSGTTQSVTGLSAGTTYYYRVRAVNATATSANSNTITTITLPPAPSVSAATNILTTSFTANWSAATGAATYKVDVSLSSTFASGVTTYNSIAALSQAVSGLVAGSAYFYRVAAVNAAGSSGWSVTIAVDLLPLAPPIPIVSPNTCGPKLVTFGTPPGGVTWYWQNTNSTGTSTATTVTSNSTRTVKEEDGAGPFYYRARNNSNGLWSAATEITAATAKVDPVDLTVTTYDPVNNIAQATARVVLSPPFSVTAGNSFTARIAITPECNELMNWTEELVYDNNGTLIGNSKDYQDGMGTTVQSQVHDFVSDKILVTQPLFDSRWQPAGATLAAPIWEEEFMYKRRFVTNASGQKYGPSDFDLPVTSGATGEVFNPKPVGTDISTLGWYYSSNNNLEKATPVAQYPYSRGYTPPGPDPTTSTSAGPGDAFKMGSTHESKSDRYAISSGELDHYDAIAGHFQGAVPSQDKGFKFVSTDPNGLKTIAFVTADGLSVATARITGGTAPAFTYDNWNYTFYNATGQVVASVAPNGVNTGSTALPAFTTTYQYDHLGRLIETISPDEGTSRFVYSTDGKIRFSENQVQRDASPKRFSYTNYDYLGRLIESGEYKSNGTNPFVFEPHSTGSPTSNSVLGVIDNSGFTGVSEKVDTTRCGEHIFITYDVAGAGAPETQSNLYGQVSKTENANASTWYSYDEFGQVAWTRQSITGLGTKAIEYTYDYFGNVTMVAYQPGVSGDKFYHHYEYDKDQRLTNVYTSFDGTTKTLQAKYKYYLHGPLKRVELAGNLQGIDYVYTIDGSLKTINHSDPAKDPGGDGSNGFAADIFGEMLNYHDNDYAGAGYSAGSVTAAGIANQYNGAIKAQSWFTPVDNFSGKKVYGYEYDPLYQLSNAKYGSLTGTAGSYSASFSGSEAYREGNLSYDKNGNIQSLLRKGRTGNTIADYDYDYISNSNQLDKVKQTGGGTLMDYTYNTVGQMTQQTEGSDTLKVLYNAYGLVKEVQNGSSQSMQKYYYDDRGDLVKKEYFNSNGSAVIKTVFYVNDASGNVMAIYESTGSTVLTEVPVYAAGRIGMYKPVSQSWFYEVNDHLGNVRGVIGPPRTDVFTATMETENESTENVTFNSTIAPRATFVAANNTPGGDEVIRLNNARLVGPAKKLKVAPGDVITAEVWAYYENGSGYSSTVALSSLVNAVAGAFGGVSGAPGESGQIYSSFNSGLNGFAGAAGSGNDNVPAAYLNMIMFDNNLLTDPSVLPMSAIPVTSASNFNKVKLTIGPITIPAPGTVYIYVNTASNSTNYVNFDDLTITHLHSAFVAGADYYPFGLTMSDREITREPYRYGYQGQFAEKDSLTNWNAFQLRMYDARFGRWLSPDPYGQYSSPYVGMGNEPVSGVDPDGGFAVDPISTFNLAEGITVTASRLSSISWGSVAAFGTGLLNNAIASSFKPLDDVHYNTQTGKTTVVKTNDNYDEMYVDGKRTGYSSREAWKTYAPDAQVFGGYTSAFYSAAYGSLLRNGDVFARLYRNASSTAAQSALMKATVQNRDPTALYATLAIPAVIITGGELIGAVSAFSGEAAFGSKLLGYQSRLFGRFHPKYLPDGVKGWLNRGPVRTGWSNKGGQHVFRTAVGRPGTKFKIDWFFK